MSWRRIGISMLLLVISISIIKPSFSQQGAFAPNLADLAAGKKGKLLNRAVSSIEKEGQSAIRFDERPGVGLAFWPEVEFTNGTIAFDVHGKNVLQQSFVGVAFHGQGEDYEAVYFRPFNFRASDPVRKSHAVQYISSPKYPWDRLRKEQPGKYEKPVAPVPDPDGWFHARIVVDYPKISVFVNDAVEPSLVVEQLSDRKSGWVGLWVGEGSGGEFANFKVSPASYK